MALSARTRLARLVVLALPTLIVLASVGGTLSVAVSLQSERIRQETAERVRDVATSLAELSEVRAAVQRAVDAGSQVHPADADDLAPMTADLQPLADLVESAAGVYYVVITDDEGVRITHPRPAERGVPVDTTAEPVLRGREFLGTEDGASGPSLRAKVPVRADDGTIVGMVAVGVLESSIAAQSSAAMSGILPWGGGALLAGTVASSALSAAAGRRFRRLDAAAAQHDRIRATAAALREQSHEFHTQLHVIHGLVSHGDDDEALRYIERIAPVGGAPAATGSPQAGAPMRRAAIDALRAEAGRHGARLELDLDDAPVDDDVLLVLGNLCRNAGEAGATLVRCRLRGGDGGIAGSVDDDGPGIPPAEAERVFAPGYSSKPDARGGGRGIGLDLVRRAVTSRGGTIEVGRSALGGARFAFEMGPRR